MLAPLLVPLGRAANMGDASLAWIMSGASICFVAGSLFWGRQADASNLPKFLKVGFLGALLGLSLFGASLSLSILGIITENIALVGALLGRSVIFGFMASLIPVVAQAFALGLSTMEDRTKGVSGIGLGYSLSAIVGPALGSGLLALSPFAPLLVAPVILGLAGCIVIFTLQSSQVQRRYGDEGSRPSTGGSDQSTSGEPPNHSGRLTWRSRRLLGIGMMIWFGSNTLVVLFPFFLMDSFGLSIARSGSFVGVVLTITAIFSIATQIFITRRWRWRPQGLLMAGITFMISGTIVIIAGGTEWTFAAGVILNGIGGAMAMPGYTLWIGSTVTHGLQPKLAGAMEAASSVSAALVPVLGVAMFKTSSTMPVIVAASCFVIVGLCAFGSRVALKD